MKNFLIGYTTLVAFIVISIATATLLSNRAVPAIAATPGNLVNYYCGMTRAELDNTNDDGTPYLRWCSGNPDDTFAGKGFLGWDDIDGESGNIVISPNKTLENPYPVNSNPVKDTRCSVVQHDGLDSTGDVYVQYSADADNYCKIYHSDYHGITLRKNVCKFSNEAEKYYEVKSDDPSFMRLKSEFSAKCPIATLTPTPTVTTKPTANLNTVCTAGQTYGNLSYTMSLTSIKPADKFEKNEWYMCMNPKTNTNHAHVYTNYFGSKATYKAATSSASELPSWACYRIGNVNTYLRPGNDYINYNFDQNNDLDYGNGSLKKDINDMARWIDGEGQAGRMNKNVTFTTKVNLWAGGGFNDQIAAPAGIKINTSACVQPSATPTVTATVTPTVPPVVCKEWKTENLISGEFNASKANARSFDLGTLTFNSVAKKYPVTLAAKWGWTGAEGTNNQFGNAFSPKVQNNEEHNVNIQFIDAQSAATKTMSTFCGDLGNTLSYDDGINLLDIDTPSTELDKFKLCRKNITPETNDGVASSLMTLNLENKYDSVKISSVLDYTPEEYAQCVKDYSPRKCNQSHYSMVQVTYCTKEG